MIALIPEQIIECDGLLLYAWRGVVAIGGKVVLVGVRRIDIDTDIVGMAMLPQAQFTRAFDVAMVFAFFKFALQTQPIKAAHA